MSAYLVVLPGSPALVAELAPADGAGARLLAAARELIHEIVDRGHGGRIELVGSRDNRWRTGLAGSFAAWGASDVSVGEGNYLPELIQRYVLGELATNVASTRGRLGKINPSALTIVAVDGSAGLTPRAPLALVEGGTDADAWCRNVLSGRAPAEPAGPAVAPWLAERGVVEPDLWAELAERTPVRARLALADTSLGVGRYVAGWQVQP